MMPFEAMQKHYRQRDLAAREWKEKGGKVIGYLCDKVPEEMIMAAGFLPLRITGDPLGDTEAADRYTEPYYEGFVRSTLNRILTGEYAFLDHLIIPHSRDTVVMLYHILQEVQTLDPDLRIPDFYLFETLHTKLYLTDLYNRDRIQNFKNKLEEWSGKEITNKALSEAINITNENKVLLKKVAELRAAEPPRISGVEALQLVGSSMFMYKEEHNKLLAEYLAEDDKLPSRDGFRLFVAGSPHDNLQFYELIESYGAIIVAEDNCWGNRYSDSPVKTSGDPMTAIADRYQSKSPCPWTFSIDERVEYCLSRAIEAKVQGIVYFISEYDYTESFDYPNIRNAFEEKGIPIVCFRDQKYLLSDSDTERIRTGIEELVNGTGVNT